MDDRIVDIGLAGLRARAAAVRARTVAAGGDIARAIVDLEASVDQLDAVQLPWLRAVLLLDLARLRDQSGDRVAAGIDAKAAAAVLAGLDVTLTPADAELLERLVTAAANGRALTRTASLARDGAWWVASFNGSSVRLQDTKGLRYLAELVACAGIERHVLDLVDRVEGVAAANGLDRRMLGDAGDVLDAARPGGVPPSHRTATGGRRRGTRRRRTGNGRAPPGRARPAGRPTCAGVRSGGPEPAGGVGGRARPPQRHPGAAQLRSRELAAADPAAGGRSTGVSAPASTAPTNRMTVTRSAGSFSPD